jgi:hypothetical protein
MSDGSRVAPLLGTLLSVAFRERIIASGVDSGIARLAAAVDEDVTLDAWRAAVADAVGGCTSRHGCRPAHYNATARARRR